MHPDLTNSRTTVSERGTGALGQALLAMLGPCESTNRSAVIDLISPTKNALNFQRLFFENWIHHIVIKISLRSQWKETMQAVCIKDFLHVVFSYQMLCRIVHIGKQLLKLSEHLSLFLANFEQLLTTFDSIYWHHLYRPRSDVGLGRKGKFYATGPFLASLLNLLFVDV